MKSLVRHCLYALALLLGLRAQAADSTGIDPDQFGPIHFGMSAEAARAATPQWPWVEHRSELRQRLTMLRAANAWALDGQRFDVQIEPGYYGAYTLVFERRASSVDAEECFAVVNALITDFEARFGAFEVPMSLREQRATGDISVQRSAEGYPIVVGTPGEVTREAVPELDAGRDSELAVLAQTDAAMPDARSWRGERPADRRGRSARIDGDYERVDSNPTCSVRAEISQAGTPPAEQRLGSDAPLRLAPSSALHHSLDELLPLPEVGIDVLFDCRVNRASGALYACAPSARNRWSRAELTAARKRLAQTSFDASAFDPDDPAPLRADVRIALRNSDRLALAVDGAPILALREVRWTRRPSGSDLERAYPPGALTDEIEAQVRANCQIQRDMSVACIDAVVSGLTAPEYERAFQLAAYEVLTKFTAETVLRSGDPSTGAWVAGVVVFRLAD